MKNITTLLFCLFSISSLFGQLLIDKNKFDWCDTLRGSLNEYRTNYNVIYYDLLVDVNPEAQHINGRVKMNFESVEANDIIQIDLFDRYEITNISMDDKNGDVAFPNLKWKRDCEAIFVKLPFITNPGQVYTVNIEYNGKPIAAKRAPWDGGFVWEKDDNDKHWIGVACQGLGASSWWPNKDHLSDEPENGMMIRIIVPNNLVAVSNGNLINKVAVAGNKKQYNWKVTYPINNYNVSVNIGDYVHFGETFNSKETGKDLALDYYVLSYNFDKARNQFQQVKPMLACFEDKLGPYPFYRDGFALIETPYLGMEHQSGIAYGNNYKTGYNGNDFSRIGLTFDYIIIHEAGHEWWGNNISCKDNADLWIHEGFCTYSEALYVECMYDYQKAMDYVNAKKKSVRNKKPIRGVTGVNNEGAGDMYVKGMLFLNTLRHVVDNDDKWFEIIKGLNIDFYLKTVDSDDIINYFNEKTGRNLRPIFEQYVYNANLPVLEYKTSGRGNKTKLSYRWKADVNNFDMPILVGGDKMEWIYPTTNWQDIKIKSVKAKDFKIDEEHFYIKTNKKN